MVGRELLRLDSDSLYYEDDPVSMALRSSIWILISVALRSPA
jgi:hypothetical protein